MFNKKSILVLTKSNSQKAISNIHSWIKKHSSKAIFIILFQILLFSSQAENDIKRVLYYDKEMGSNYLLLSDLTQIKRYFFIREFQIMNTQKLISWMNLKLQTKSCYKTVVLQLSDITSMQLINPMDKTSILYRYLDAGGRYVAPTGNTLYNFRNENDLKTTVLNYLSKVIGVTILKYGIEGKKPILTKKGKEWGLTASKKEIWMNYLQTGVPKKSVSKVFVKKKGADSAVLWLKNINKDYPNSGLIGLCLNPLHAGSKADNILSVLYKLCTYQKEAKK